MNTQNMTREQISAFVDNEASDGHVEITLAALHQDAGRATWNLYHQIGDALRSDDLNTKLSADFNARLFARLEAEPVIIAPALTSALKNAARKNIVTRYAMPGMAAAAVAVVAFLTVPQMMTHEVPAVASNAQPVVMAAAAPNASTPVVVASENGEVLRDPQIDEYLLAHQRFSPSVYSTAQYARSADFTIDSDNK
jgi:sigma-E factor negative regulatory protein RseA